ncbi:MAG: Ig-like domain-containing protein [Gammaproteobacteria bacterium]|nr:Ig-like domain-containing protein [Gammaproteobacteria bacterium]
MFLNACSSEFEEVSDYPNGRIAISVSNDSVYLSEVGSNFTVSAKLLDEQGVAYVDQPQFIWTSASTNVVSVDANGLITANAIGQTTVTVSTTDLSSQMQVVVSEDVVTLNGTARYEDREYGATGFITQQSYYKAIRHAKVVVVDANGEAIGGIAPVYTDANGKFVIAGLLNTLHYIRISAITDSTLGMDLAIKDRQNALYSISKQVDIQRAANFTMDVPLISDASGAFNILDVFVSAAQFTLEHTALPLVSLSAYWEPNNSDGTYFCNGHDAIYCDNGKGIYIFNSPSGDTDEYDDDVLFHEFGHYFAQTISRDDSYGGCHVLSSTDLDLRLSWSEGWGDFFPAAVKSWLANDVQRVGLLSTQVSFKTAYIDTYQNSQQIFLQLDATLSASIYKSAGNELAVAKILLSLYDRYGMKSIVDVLTGYLPDVATPVNLESFWDGWLAIHSPNSADKDVLKGIYNERSVFYQEDVFEADNAINPARKINLNIDETHYLYSEQQATDIDYVAFDTIANNQYTLSTGNLTSGADTYIRVLNADGTPLTVASVVVENDDADESAYYGYDGSCGMSRIRNNATALSSRLTFIAPATGTYYAELRTTVDPAPYFSAGRYGTFTFKVVQN